MLRKLKKYETMNIYEVNGFSGRSTPCKVFVCNYGGEWWYLVKGGRIFNATDDEISEGVNVEMLNDHDVLTTNEDVFDIETFEDIMMNHVEE